MQLTDKQKEFWKNANRRWNIKEGATRSGKTYLDYFMIPRRIKACRGLGLILLMGNTRGTLERNILEPMRSIWGEEFVGVISPSGTVNLFGKKCYALGADKVTQVAKLQGSGIEYCYGDEVTTWNEDVFSMLKSRLSPPGAIFDGTCNPDSPNHWFLRFLESDADIFRQHYTIYDNPMLSADFVTSLEKEYRGTVYFDRFILGKWALAEGLIYPMFRKDVHITSEMPKTGAYYISVDYGTANPCSMGLWCVDGKRAVRISEFYHDSRREQRQMTDEEYYSELLKLSDGMRIEYVVVDPSAASFIETIKRHGKFPVKKAKNSVTDGIRLTAGYLSEERLLINPACRSFIREIMSYRWDSEAECDKPVKQNDHAMDDMRYFASTVLKKIW